MTKLNMALWLMTVLASTFQQHSVEAQITIADSTWQIARIESDPTGTLLHLKNGHRITTDLQSVVFLSQIRTAGTGKYLILIGRIWGIPAVWAVSADSARAEFQATSHLHRFGRVNHPEFGDIGEHRTFWGRCVPGEPPMIVTFSDLRTPDGRRLHSSGTTHIALTGLEYSRTGLEPAEGEGGPAQIVQPAVEAGTCHEVTA